MAELMVQHSRGGRPTFEMLIQSRQGEAHREIPEAIAIRMANAYVKDPRKIAKPGDVVPVKVLEVDPKRRRISQPRRFLRALWSAALPEPDRAALSTDQRKRLRPGEARAGSSNPGSVSGDAIAEPFRRAGLTDKTPGRQ